MSALRERFLAMERRERILLSSLAALVVLALAYTLLGLGGGGDLAIDIPGGPLRPPGSTATPSPGGTPPPVTPETFGGKDPFEPLVTDATSGGGAPASGSGSGSGTGSGSAGSGTGSGGSTSTGGPASGGGTSGRANRVTLADVFRRSGRLIATVTVDGTRYTVEPGDRFGRQFQLISLTSRCGGFAFGDERFSLCLGQEVRK